MTVYGKRLRAGVGRGLTEREQRGGDAAGAELSGLTLRARSDPAPDDRASTNSPPRPSSTPPSPVTMPSASPSSATCSLPTPSIRLPGRDDYRPIVRRSTPRCCSGSSSASTLRSGAATPIASTPPSTSSALGSIHAFSGWIRLHCGFEEKRMSETFGPCSRCGTPLPYRALTHSIAFPDDQQSVVDLIDGTFNVVICLYCEQTWSIQPPVIAVNHHSRELLIARTTLEEVVAQLGEATQKKLDEASGDGRLCICETYAELAARVVEWTNTLMQEVSGELFALGEAVAVDGLSTRTRLPLTLRILARQLDGRLPIHLHTRPPLPVERQRQILRPLFEAMILDQVQALYKTAFHGPGLVSFLELVESTIPAECLDEGVRGRFLADCRGGSADFAEHPERLDPAFRAEYKNAVVHAVAGAPNPRGADWAEFMVALWLWSRNPNVLLPKAVLLDESVLTRTVSFEDLFDLLQAYRSREPDVARWHTAEKIAEHFGMGERMARELINGIPKVRLPEDDVDGSSVARKLIDATMARLGDEASGAGAAGVVMAKLCEVLLANGRIDEAVEAAERVLDGTREDEDVLLALSRIIEAFNRIARYGEAMHLVAQFGEPLTERLDAIRPGVVVDYLNELGNVLRYSNEPMDALEVYSHAMRLAEDRDDVPSDAITVLRRNRAIVLRELGQYHEALRDLEALLRDTEEHFGPTYASLRNSLALTCLHLGLLDAAAEHANHAVSVSLSGGFPYLRSRILVNAARISSRLEKTQEAVLLLEEAASGLDEHDPNTLLVADAILECATRHEVPDGLVRGAERSCRDTLAAWKPGDEPGDLLRPAYALARWSRSNGCLTEARELVREMADRLPVEVEPFWQWFLLRAQLTPPGEAEHWAFLRRAREIATGDSPLTGRGSDVACWLDDKAELHEFTIDAAVRLHKDGELSTSDLLSVFDFANASDVATSSMARLAAHPDAPLDDPTSIVSAGERLFAETRIVAFLEGSTEIHPVVLDMGCEDAGLLEPMSASDVRREVADFHRKMRFVQPGVPSNAPRSLDRLLRHLGRILSRGLAPGRHICVLPSASLLGVPFHAALLEDGSPLIRRSAVSVAPNLSALLALLNRPADPSVEEQRRVIVRVDSVQDDSDFIERSQKAATRIRSHLGAENTALLEGTAATAEATLNAMARCAYAVVLAHGVSAGATWGTGCCVSDGVSAPPNLLPVTEVPQVARFILSARDLESTRSVSPFVALVACSTGRSRSGRGGSRVGLERGLFGAGANTVLAPLWDVEQASALAFLERFYEIRSERPTASLGEVYRAALIEAYDACDDLFYWAPFQLSGAWLWPSGAGDQTAPTKTTAKESTMTELMREILEASRERVVEAVCALDAMFGRANDDTLAADNVVRSWQAHPGRHIEEIEQLARLHLLALADDPESAEQVDLVLRASGKKAFVFGGAELGIVLVVALYGIQLALTRGKSREKTMLELDKDNKVVKITREVEYGVLPDVGKLIRRLKGPAE